MLADRDIPGATDALIAAVAAAAGPVILVANEVGWGIVPDNALARRFRDEAGRLNQAVLNDPSRFCRLNVYLWYWSMYLRASR